MVTPLAPWTRLPPRTFGERARSSRETKDLVAATQFSKQGTKGQREPEIRQPVRVPVTLRTVSAPGQAACWGGREPLAAPPEINAALQGPALREHRLEEMDPRTCRNLEKHPQVATPTGLQTSHAYTSRGRDSPAT